MVVGLAAAVIASVAPTGVGATGTPGPLVAVIVQAHDVAAAGQAVLAVGGRPTVALSIVSGVAARVPADRVAALAATPGVVAVTPDERLAVNGSADGSSTSGNGWPVYRREVGADRLAGAGYSGAGAVVALVDTGVTPGRDLQDRLVTGLLDPANRNRTVSCIDFSGEASCADNYGHGTFMAGLIAGTGAQSGGIFRGVAPQARILSVKVAGRDGSADVTKLLAAIQWVVSFKDRYGISVLNLSLGTDSRVTWRHDPLNLAVERAWRSGVAVIVAASNRGPAPGSISKPGDDPLVVTVGAVDDRGTPAVSDDWSPDFSARGPTAADGLAKPDVVAPGAHVVSLRAPGSLIEQQAPSSGPLTDTPYRRGSGTSMSTAITSGVAALIWSARPDWRGDRWPDRLKFALTTTAHPVALDDPGAVGSGAVNAADAAALSTDRYANGDVVTLSDATGDLDDTRGDVRVMQDCTTAVDRLFGRTESCVVSGERTAQRRMFDASRYASGEWTEDSWYAGQFTGNSWEGNSWEGNSWEGNSWEGASWQGNDDPEVSYGSPVTGSVWYGAWH
jgi:serine protease AprX